ncbi:MAG TPA: hypothetical protein VMV43_07580 [Candidatus Nanopelagicaceae bacterium]|nr:hypothetical protein [Candidatus Nanopelagicaceae bacterium]
MPESSIILNDLNKVFIPCRTILEMEALTSLFLEYYNYDLIREIPKSQPSSQKIIEIFQILDCRPLENIIKYFVDGVVQKLKPIVMYERDHHDRFRMGNIVAYTKTRVCLYVALHRLKLKFLFIKHFMDIFKDNEFKLNKPEEQVDLGPHLFISSLYKDYTHKNNMNLKLMLSSKRVSDRVSKLLDLKDIITNEDIINAITFKKYLDDNNRIKFIMREIKASIFVCKVMFAQIDVFNPFSVGTETMINAEEIMLNQDFIPVLIPAISSAYSENKKVQLEDLFRAYEFMMRRVLEGINYAIEIASGGQILLDLEDTIYNSGNIFDI